MQTRTQTMKQRVKKEDGFTLVEVIAVLVILGILAAVAIPKFFDMQDTARLRAIDGAIGELNGQVALAFAQNALNGYPNGAGGYEGYTGDLGTNSDFQITGQAAETPGTGTIGFRGTSFFYVLTWNAPTGNDSPGFFSTDGTTAAAP